MTRRQLKGTCAVITGGNAGIGYAIAETFVEEGADLVLIARDETRLESARENLEKTGADVVTISTDSPTRRPST